MSTLTDCLDYYCLSTNDNKDNSSKDGSLSYFSNLEDQSHWRDENLHSHANSNTDQITASH